MADNRTALIDLMDRLALTKADVASIAKASPATVDAWLKPETSKSSRQVPDVVLDVLSYSAGDAVCASPSEAAELLGTTIARVKRAAGQSRALLTHAMSVRRKEDGVHPLETVKKGGHVVMSLGPLSFLLVPGFAFLPVEGHTGKRVKLGVPARIVETRDSIRLETEVDEWNRTREEQRSAVAAARLASLLEEQRRLGSRLADAKEEEDAAAIRRIETALALLDKQIDAVEL